MIRDFRMIALKDEEGLPYFEVTAIHDEQGYRDIRAALARDYECARIDPEIEIIDVNLLGDRNCSSSIGCMTASASRKGTCGTLKHIRAVGLCGAPARSRCAQRRNAPLGRDRSGAIRRPGAGCEPTDSLWAKYTGIQ